ncbi:STAS-like domain-containing protein [Pseudocolwellia agarivorans]|uniref:STAS-like domain-containing protein n=1 Tax=Pseudocolwellia agarivorans TaxID=1911682 RepID=UPI003F88430E
MEIKIIDIIGRTAVSRISGEKLHTAIKQNIDSRKITIDFSGVEFYASPFFNTAIAPFLEIYDLENLQANLSFINLSPVGKNLLNQVIHNAIDFYSKSQDDRDSLSNEVTQGLNNFKDE